MNHLRICGDMLIYMQYQWTEGDWLARKKKSTLFTIILACLLISINRVRITYASNFYVYASMLVSNMLVVSSSLVIFLLNRLILVKWNASSDSICNLSNVYSLCQCSKTLLTCDTWVLYIVMLKLSMFSINITNTNIKDLTLGGSLFPFLNKGLAQYVDQQACVNATYKCWKRKQIKLWQQLFWFFFLTIFLPIARSLSKWGLGDMTWILLSWRLLFSINLRWLGRARSWLRKPSANYSFTKFGVKTVSNY